jgi:DNA repair photolyase
MASENLPPFQAHRGAVSNNAGRYDLARTRTDDGWWHDPEADETTLRTTVTEDASRKILARNTSPDVPFDRSINPYRGCEHGCVYCFARPTHAYLGLSPGLDFESQLFAKPRAAELLAAELRKRTYRCAPIAIGTNTDPYQPIERERRIMRDILEVLSAFNHPVTITTKSALVGRDIDILGPMAERRLTAVGISITTLDRDLARQLEPRASVPAKRLETIRRLSEAGIPTAVMVAPVIPLVTDHELEKILAAAAEAGAAGAHYILLRLPLEVAGLVEEWLNTHRPGKAKHVMSLISQNRGGKVYDSEWGRRMIGTGPFAELLAQRFKLATRKLGLDQSRRGLDSTLFRPPPQPGDQLSLL